MLGPLISRLTPGKARMIAGKGSNTGKSPVTQSFNSILLKIRMA